jgi:hypothetical protein
MATKTYAGERTPPACPDTLAEDARTSIARREIWVVSRLVLVDTKGAVHRWLTRYSITASRINMRAVIAINRGIHVRRER